MVHVASAGTALRLSLHILAATVWVGGQITLAGLVPAMRTVGGEAPKVFARAFARLSWPAFALLVVTGFWNMAADNLGKAGTAWKIVLGVKIGVVVLSGLSAWLHARATSRRGIAIWGALTGTSAVAALVMGVFLAG